MSTEEILAQLEKFQLRLFIRGANGVEPASPAVIAENLLLIRGLLIQLVDKVYEAELDYRHSKSAKFDELLQVQAPNGKPISKSAAFELLDLDADLINKKVGTERLRNFMKHIDGLCTAVQSVLKVQTASDKSQY